VFGLRFVPAVLMPKLGSLVELERRARGSADYLQLAIIAAENLGGCPSMPYEDANPGDPTYLQSLLSAMRILRDNAHEVGVAEVLVEINSCRDLVK